MVSREDFLQLKSAVQELRSEMRKLAYDTFRLVPTRRKKLEDQLEASSLNAPPEPVLTCVQCGLEYGESSNTDGCRYHSGRFQDYPTYYKCCKKGYRGSDLPPRCRKGRHHSKHHGDYLYENYFKYMEEQSNNAKEIWMEMDLLDPLVKSCMWSERNALQLIWGLLWLHLIRGIDGNHFCGGTCHGDMMLFVHRAEQREETSPSQQGDVPEDVPWEEKKADSGEKMEVEAESEDENYGMLVVRNRTAQLAPVDTENQEPVEQEEPAGDNLENPAMEGDDMEPQQIEQVQLRRSNRIRQPPERLGSVTYF